jgi:hypothetical protein
MWLSLAVHEVLGRELRGMWEFLLPRRFVEAQPAAFGEPFDGALCSFSERLHVVHRNLRPFFDDVPLGMKDAEGPVCVLR